VDPVSRILIERERSKPRLFPWAMIAFILHGGLAGTIFLMSRNAAARPAQLPAVSVRIVQPEPQRGRSRSTQPAARPTRPPKKETPVPEPEPTAPEPVATEPPEVTSPVRPASEDAMAAPERRSTPRPTPIPAPSGGSGLSVGGGNGREIAGIPSDFHFAYYVQRMLALIESRWYKPAVPAGTKARARFTINRDGRLSRIELESNSGNSSFDRAALRALYAANPLPPLPPAYRKSSLTVHLTFSE
jgi:TonB family protein